MKRAVSDEVASFDEAVDTRTSSKALVDCPEEVQIKEVIGDHAHVLELEWPRKILGKVIGKGGAHASAIRTLMAAASGKEKKRYILEIIEH